MCVKVLIKAMMLVVFNLHIWANSIWPYISFSSYWYYHNCHYQHHHMHYILYLKLMLPVCWWRIKKKTLLNNWWSFIFSSGYYPKGGGEVRVAVNPIKQLLPLQLLERGPLARITGRAFVAGVLPLKVSCYQCYLIMNCYSQKWSWVVFFV